MSLQLPSDHPKDDRYLLVQRERKVESYDYCSAPTPSSTYQKEFWVEETKWSRGNPAPYKWRGRDVGGNFTVYKREYEGKGHPYRMIRYVGGNPVVTRIGRVYPTRVDITPGSYHLRYPELDPSSELELRADGSTAISRVAPTSPNVSLAAIIGEMKEGLPRLVGSSFWKSKSVGLTPAADEWLNYQFGIKPMVSEAIAVAQTSQRVKKILDQYRRDAGKLVRRHYTFPTWESDPIVTIKTGLAAIGTAPTYGDFTDYSNAKWTRTETRTRNVSFSGAFQWFIPEPTSAFIRAANQLREFERVWGIIPGPEVIWELTPWSWAIDWVSNAGDLVSNLQRFSVDGLVMPYGYVMSEETITWYDELTGIKLNPRYGGTPCPPVFQRFTTTIKRRRKASPFGFWIDWDGLNPTQWSILAALGISRASR